MKVLLHVIAMASTVFLIGCSTTQDVTIAGKPPTKAIRTISQVTAEGNSPEMDAYLEAALAKQGLRLGPKSVQGNDSSGKVDALVSYVDVWRWDLAMYLKSLSVRLHEGGTGNLLAVAHWSESPLHGFRDAKLVMEKLVAELMEKVRTANNSPR